MLSTDLFTSDQTNHLCGFLFFCGKTPLLCIKINALDLDKNHISSLVVSMPDISYDQQVGISENPSSQVVWPSGLRRWIKAPVSQEAWVQIPPLPQIYIYKPCFHTSHTLTVQCMLSVHELYPVCIMS